MYNKNMKNETNTDNIIPLPRYPKHDDFAILSPCFYFNPIKTQTVLKKEFSKVGNNGIPFIEYGSQEEFTNKIYTHIIRLHEELEKLDPKYRHVIVMDSYDTIYLGGNTILEMLQRYRNQAEKKPMVVLASEKECYPEGSQIYYKEKLPSYLNAGLMIGEAHLIKTILSQMIKDYDLNIYKTVNDKTINHHQILWHRYINEGILNKCIYIDYLNEFFYCMNNCEPEKDMEYVNHIKIRIKSTGNIPKLFHYNRCFSDGTKEKFYRFYMKHNEG